MSVARCSARSWAARGLELDRSNGKNLGQDGRVGEYRQAGQGVLGACLITSAALLNSGHYACAARNVVICDQLVAKSASSFGSSADNPNPFGGVRGRLGDLFFTIDSRILGNSPNSTWPLTSPPPACR